MAEEAKKVQIQKKDWQR